MCSPVVMWLRVRVMTRYSRGRGTLLLDKYLAHAS
jgi:hypothetical protein